MRKESTMFNNLLRRIDDFVSRNHTALVVGFTVLFGLTAMEVLAGTPTSGTATAAAAFDDAWATVYTWMSSALGRIIAGTLIIAGIAMGIARMSVQAIIPGVAAGFTMALAPVILETVVAGGATL